MKKIFIKMSFLWLDILVKVVKITANENIQLLFLIKKISWNQSDF